jgi:hypothetical protein
MVGSVAIPNIPNRLSSGESVGADPYFEARWNWPESLKVTPLPFRGPFGGGGWLATGVRYSELQVL